MIDIKKTIFLVDGPTEIRAIREKFKKETNEVPNLRKVGCNGKSVSAQGYANAAYGTLILALRSYYTCIICILDRERRPQSPIKLSCSVKEAIVNQVCSTTKYRLDDVKRKLYVCVPDIMFENWIVSDVEGIKRHVDFIKGGSKQKYYDGKSGASVLKGMMKVPYKKTLHGPVLFKATNFSTSKKNSPSFKGFIDIIGL